MTWKQNGQFKKEPNKLKPRARWYQSHTLPNLDLDIASSVADSASCMKEGKKELHVRKSITKR